MELLVDRAFEPAYGEAVQIGPLVQRVTANNPGPFTGWGTNTYLVGRDAVAVVDPGPEDAGHRGALLAAIAGRRVRAILVTHSHRDHTAGAPDLAAATGALIVGPPPVRPPAGGPVPNVDYAFRPERVLRDGAHVGGDGWTLRAVATPGHLENHLCFALPEAGFLFSGDHVMGWSSTVVLPPHGSMRDYRASLAALLTRPETLYLPGHGPPVGDPHARVRALLDHRRERERGIVAALGEQPAAIPELVARLYPGLAPELRAGAAGSIAAHLAELIDRGAVVRAADRFALRA